MAETEAWLQVGKEFGRREEVVGRERGEKGRGDSKRRRR